MSMPDPALIDAHLHLWDPDRVDYPWLAAEPALDRRFRLEDVMQFLARNR